MTKSAYQSSKIFGLDLFSNSYDQLLTLLEDHLKSEKSLKLVMTPNPEQIVISRKSKTFLDHLRSADILLPDGIGLVWASRILAGKKNIRPIEERISGREVTAALLESAKVDELKVLIVGGKNYLSSSQAREGQVNLYVSQRKYQAHWTEGYADVSQPTPEEEEKLTKLIKQRMPDVIFVAFGAPFQEKWLIEHKQVLSTAKVKLAVVVGGAIDVLIGKVVSAPLWIQKLNLEWAFRLLHQPWRWKRQLRLLIFIKLVLQEWLSTD